MSHKINMRPAMEHLRRVEQTSQRLGPISSRKATSNTFSPLLPEHYEELKLRLENILDLNLVPSVYRRTLVEPFYTALEENDQAWFGSQLEKDGSQIPNIVAAILQNFDPSYEGRVSSASTEAFREVVSDLYLNFMKGASDEVLCLAPLPHWHEDDLVTSSSPDLGVGITIFNMPLRYASRAPITWGYLGREVAGRDILKAYPGALKELKNLVQLSFNRKKVADIAPYWTQWFEEAISDVLAVLNMGPAAAFSLIAFLRSQNDEFRLSSVGYVNDQHSIDLIRGFIAAFVLEGIKTEGHLAKSADLVMEEVKSDAGDVSQLKWDVVLLGDVKKLPNLLQEFYRHCKQDPPHFKDPICQARELVKSPRWKSEFVEFLVSKDVPQTKKDAANTSAFQNILYKENSLADFKKSAQLFVEIVMKSKLQALGGRSFLEIRSWSEKDEKISIMFRILLKLHPELDPVAAYKAGFFAAHVVSAAVMESITVKGEDMVTEDKLHALFERMITILQTMHKTNPLWKLPEELSVSTEEDLFVEESIPK